MSSGWIFIITYVNDLVIGGDHLTDINKVKMLLSVKFEMKYMNELHYFMGIEVIRTHNVIFALPMPLHLESSVQVWHVIPQDNFNSPQSQLEVACGL